eukprot:Selendium_serpulae@DN6144_c1_g1_i1.p2
MFAYVTIVTYVLIALQCAVVFVKAPRARALILSLASLLYCSGVPNRCVALEYSEWPFGESDVHNPSVTMDGIDSVPDVPLDSQYDNVFQNVPPHAFPDTVADSLPHEKPARNNVRRNGKKSQSIESVIQQGPLYDDNYGAGHHVDIPSQPTNGQHPPTMDSSRSGLKKSKRTRPDTPLQIKIAQKNVEKGARKGMNDAKRMGRKNSLEQRN